MQYLENATRARSGSREAATSSYDNALMSKSIQCSLSSLMQSMLKAGLA